MLLINPKTYPLLALRDLVVFPRGVSSLFVGREKSMEATRKAMDADRHIVLAAQKDSTLLDPSVSDVHGVGVLCEILQLLKMPDGTFKLLVEGLNRVRIGEVTETEGTLHASVVTLETVEPQADQGEVFSRTSDLIVEKFREYNRRQNALSAEALDDLLAQNNPEYLIDCVAGAVNMPQELKQTILEQTDLFERSQMVHSALASQMEVFELENSIHDRVRDQMDKMQRKFYLHEQMKILREEMNEGELDEFESYRKKISEASLPEEVRLRAEQELAKLEKMPVLSAESTVVRNYLDAILELPWNTATEDTVDIREAEKILQNSHYGLEKVKDRILEFIAVRQLSRSSRGPILCLVGPPGVGKTSLARSMAECLGRSFVRIALGGIRDEAEIRGHRRTYIGALPGRIIHALKKAKVKNPVILLDEIDKISSDYRGNPAAALLEVLDPEQNHEFTDHYLELPFDLSQVLFIATANVMHSIPHALLDRLELIELGGYTEQEKIEIVKKHILPKKVKENGIDKLRIRYSGRILAHIIRHYTREAGVRDIERQLAQIGRKIARSYLADPEMKEVTLDEAQITKLLGARRFNYGQKEHEAQVGKANGLAWTSVGGDILNVEVALAHGKGKLSITGNLGDVMKESVSTAIGHIRSQGHLMGLPADFFDKTDIFIHVPEGAIPKDGPSAGITIATCIVSALTQNPVRNDIAMTGEITLRGMVLPIGGLKEKALAAYRGGIFEIICPEDNRKDLEEIPDSIQEKMTFHFTRKLSEVLEIALVDKKKTFSEKPGMYSFNATHLGSAPNPS